MGAIRAKSSEIPSCKNRQGACRASVTIVCVKVIIREVLTAGRIISKADKILLAILNSKMGWWLISKYCTAIQNGFQLIWKYFGQIPISQANRKEGEVITSLVDQILTAKKSDPKADTTALETE
ncbi:MAG: hypothetical protein ACK5P3_26710, partial [Dolichospermum sp.]